MSDTQPDIWSSRTRPIQEDMAFQRTMWRFQRMGWVLFATIMLLAFLGLFGDGPLSDLTASDPTGQLQIRYERFNRNEATSRTEFRISAGAGPGEDITLRLNTAFMEAFTLENILPQPTVAHSGPEGTDFTFRSSGGGPLTVAMTVRARTVGIVHSAFALNGQKPVRLWQLVYP